APAAVYSLSLHDALPICFEVAVRPGAETLAAAPDIIAGARSLRARFPALSDELLARAEKALGDAQDADARAPREQEERSVVRVVDRKSTRLNSSHVKISY